MWQCTVSTNGTSVATQLYGFLSPSEGRRELVSESVQDSNGLTIWPAFLPKVFAIYLFVYFFFYFGSPGRILRSFWFHIFYIYSVLWWEFILRRKILNDQDIQNSIYLFYWIHWGKKEKYALSFQHVKIMNKALGDNSQQDVPLKTIKAPLLNHYLTESTPISWFSDLNVCHLIRIFFYVNR